MGNEVVEAAFLGGFLGGALAQVALGAWLLKSWLPRWLRPLELRVAEIEYLLKLKGLGWIRHS